MASVQELLLAAQAKQKKSPLSMLADVINAGSTGYSEGVKLKNDQSETDLRRAQVAKTLIEAQQAQAEMAAQEQLRKQFEERLAVTTEQNLRTAQAGVAAPKPAATPAGKFETTWSQDEKGRISRSIKEVSPKQADVPTGYKDNGDGTYSFIPGGPADPATKIKTTAAPAGFRWTADGALEAIPGGPADQKSLAEKEKSDLALANQKEKATLITSKIDEALPMIDNLSAGMGSVLKNVPLTKAKDLSAVLDTVKSNLGFDQLAEMKAQTRTGASGLGALSDREMTLLTSARASLDQGQSPAQLRDSLNQIKTHYNNWLQIQDGVNPYTSKPAAPAAPAAIADGSAAQGKMKVIRLSDNLPGTIDASDFDASKYKRR